MSFFFKKWCVALTEDSHMSKRIEYSLFGGVSNLYMSTSVRLPKIAANVSL